MTESPLPPAAPLFPSHLSNVPPPRGRNWPAALSLLFGIFGCVPEITGFLAIVLGVMGLRRARKLKVGGRGLAGAGLALGILSVGLWSIGLGVAGSCWVASEPARIVAHQYLRDYSQQNIPALLAASDPSISADQLQSLAQTLRPLGFLQDATIYGFYINWSAPEWRFNGRAQYTNGDAFFVITVVREEGTWKVRDFHVQPHPRSYRPPPQNVQV